MTASESRPGDTDMTDTQTLNRPGTRRDGNDDPFRFADDLGPAKIVHVTEHTTGLRATVVVDNVALGQAIGGVRMAPDVSTDECFGLARAMTLKNAAAGLRHGGGKAVIAADPSMPVGDKERLLRAFARAIADLDDYVPGPDMGTDETCMAWVRDEIGRAVGLPAVLGGIPLDEIGATGYGLTAAIDVAAEHIGMALTGARIAVQGFGAVGIHAARFLVERGCILVAVADSGGAIVDPHGLDVDQLVDTKSSGSVARHHVGHRIERDAIVGVECDIWIPAARPNVLRVDNVGTLRARIVAQGANIPATPEAEAVLAERGVLCLPDFIVNAGGVIAGAVEYAGGTTAEAMRTIDERIRANTATMLETASSEGISPREAASRSARRRVERAMSTQRFH
jgi:glutamate dehydrogenase/leucine dehydrogenase